MSVEAALADFAHGPLEGAGDARALMRLCLFDWAACGLAGRGEPVAVKLRDWAADTCGSGPATLFGGGHAAPESAALVNGATSHALDYDDTHFAHIGHTSVAVLPAALAVAEAVGGTLDDVIDAALVGSEGAVRTGVWLGRDHYQVGFHQTATSGTFGAALAAMRIGGLDVPEMMHGLGLAATQASGLKSQFGTMGKPLNAGLAAEAGVRAAAWARRGMTSARRGIGGPQGFGPTHHGAGDLAAFDGMGSDWRILGISHKFHACCHGLHAMLEALADRAAAPDALSEIVVTTHPRWLTVCNVPAPQTALECKFSYRLTAAMALSGVDTAAIGNFSAATAQRPDLIALRDKVEVVGDDALSEMQTRVELRHADGRREVLSADLDAPLSLTAREERLRGKAAALLGEELAEALWSAVQGEALGPLTFLMRAP